MRLQHNLKYPAYIGAEYFKNYTVIINSSEQQLVLQSQSPNAFSEKKNKSYGLALYPIDGKWKIIQINPNESFIKETYLMQEVDSIDGRPIDQFSLCDYKDYLVKKINKEEPLRITFNGRKDNLNLNFIEPSLEVFK